MPAAATERLILPPPYDQHRLESGDPMAEAIRLAPGNGAGTFVWRQGGGIFSVAVVLEPEMPLREASMAFFAGMAALGDALAAHCAPERAVRFVFPDTVTYDQARLGGGRFAVAPGCAEGDVPDWLVFAAELIADRDHLPDPGLFPETTSLREEEFDPAPAIAETFASYLMLHFDRWTHLGVNTVANAYLERIDPPMLAGSRVLENGDLVERTPSGAERRIGFAEALAACRWRGAEGPRL